MSGINQYNPQVYPSSQPQYAGQPQYQPQQYEHPNFGNNIVYPNPNTNQSMVAPANQMNTAQNISGKSNSKGVSPEVESQLFGSATKEIRNGFIRKVYSILTIQILITVAVGAIFVTDPGRNFVIQFPYIIYIAMGIYLITSFTLICCNSCAKKSPNNYILLFICTISLSIMVGAICGFFPGYVVLQAVIATVVIFVGLTIFAFVTKSDFTSYGGYLLVITLILILFGLFVWIFPTKILHTLYSALGALVFCLYIVFDTQLLMIGSKKITLSPDDYIYAALSLYLDIINLFLYLLSLFASFSSD